MDLLSLKEHHARTLLIHYCWDVDKIFTVFIERGKERLYAEAGVSVLDSNHRSSCHFLKKISCEICYEEFAANETTTMDCGHCFCNECKNGTSVSFQSLNINTTFPFHPLILIILLEVLIVLNRDSVYLLRL